VKQVLILVACVLLLSIPILNNVYADGKMPSWIKNTFIWYGQGQISEDEVLNAIKYLLQKGIIQLDTKPFVQPNNNTNSSNSTTNVFNSTMANSARDNSGIDQFYILGSPAYDKYTARFSLKDNNQVNVADDGTVSLSITDNADNVVYQNTFTVKKSDFATYSTPLTNKNYLAYVWAIPVSDVGKGISGLGNAKLIFITNENRTYSITENAIPIPSYTNDELPQIYEQDYSKSALPINQQISQCNFQITVQRAGFFTTNGFTGSQEHFRVDMQVNVTGLRNQTFSSTSMVLRDNQGIQYNHESGGTLDQPSQIPTGESRQGSVLFKKIPDNANFVDLVFQLGSDEKLKPCTFQYHIPLK